MKKTQHVLYEQHGYVERISKAEQDWWSKDASIAILTLSLSALDAITLYTVIDTVMYNSMAVSVILTIGCALALNFIPLVISKLIHLYRYKLNGVRLWMIGAMAATFLVLFAATFALRWETRELSFTGSETSMIDTTGQNEGLEATDSDGREAIAITVLLGIMPGITSLINLALGYFNGDPIKRKLDFLKAERERAVEQRDVMLAALNELDQDWPTRLYELDSLRFEAACAFVHEMTEQMRKLARLELAKTLGDPTSINMLTEPKLDPEDAANQEKHEETSKENEGGELRCA